MKYTYLNRPLQALTKSLPKNTTAGIFLTNDKIHNIKSISIVAILKLKFWLKLQQNFFFQTLCSVFQTYEEVFTS